MRNGPDKNPFRGVSDLLARAFPAKRLLHFLSYLIDLVLVFIVSYLVFLGGKAIVENSESYKKNNARYEEEITYYQDMIVEAHVAEYLIRDAHEIADNEDLSVKMAIRHVLLSYSKEDPSLPEFLEDPSEKLKDIYVGSFYSDCFEKVNFDNDYLSLFFNEYVPVHNQNNELVNFGDKTPNQYFINFYQRHAANYSGLKFVYPEGEFPYLKPEIANEVYKYLIKDDNFDRTHYDNFVGFYSSMLEDAEDIVFNAKSYQNGRYQDFLYHRQKVTASLDTTLIISIVLSYLLAVMAPMLIFRDGRSFGKIFLRLGVMNYDKSEVEVWKILLRSLLGAISSIFIAFFLVLLPPFNGSSLILYLPFITMGSLSIAMINIIIIIFVLSALNGIFMLLTHEKRSLTDLIFGTITVDVTLLDEPDYDEKDEANS